MVEEEFLGLGGSIKWNKVELTLVLSTAVEPAGESGQLVVISVFPSVDRLPLNLLRTILVLRYLQVDRQ